MERGILFPQYTKTDSSKVVSEKTFCFADVMRSDYWDMNGMEDISHEQALQLDAIAQNILLKHF